MQFEEARKTDNKDYRTWLYKKLGVGEQPERGATVSADGTVQSKVVDVYEAVELTNSGWEFDLVKLAGKKVNENHETRETLAAIGRDRNALLNLDAIEDKKTLLELQERLFGHRSPANIGRENLISRIKAEAVENGWEVGSNGNSETDSQ